MSKVHIFFLNEILPKFKTEEHKRTIEIYNIILFIDSGLLKPVEKAEDGGAGGAGEDVGDAKDAEHKYSNILHTIIKKLDSAAQNVIDTSSNINHSIHKVVSNAVGKLPIVSSVAQKVVEASNSINQGAHQIVGGTIEKVSDTAHKAVEKVSGIFHTNGESSSSI